MLKRTMDITIALVALPVALPIVFVAAALLALGGRRPALVRARRLGRGGRVFTLCYLQLPFASTTIYTALLANLPQLLNVLFGDMSIVGPRPIAPERLHRSAPAVRQVLAMRPGLCSPALLALLVARTGPESAARAEHTYRAQIAPVQLHLDLHYVRTWSPAADLRVLWSALMLLAQPGRYALLAGSESVLTRLYINPQQLACPAGEGGQPM